MRTLKMLLATTLMLIATTSVFASAHPILCETNFGEKAFTIQDNSIAFHAVKEGRNISSLEDSRTLKSHTGFRKIIYKNGNRHLISIKNTKHFDSNEDFLSITNQKGHKVTFPINCSLI